MTRKADIKTPFQVLSASEREIVFRIADDEGKVYAYVASPKWYRELVSKGYLPSRVDAFGAEFTIPRVTIPRAARRKLSDGHRAKLVAGKARKRPREAA